jgi:hypothetical protein
MPAKRDLTMRQIRQLLRLAHDGLSPDTLKCPRLHRRNCSKPDVEVRRNPATGIVDRCNLIARRRRRVPVNVQGILSSACSTAVIGSRRCLHSTENQTRAERGCWSTAQPASDSRSGTSRR